MTDQHCALWKKLLFTYVRETRCLQIKLALYYRDLGG